MDSGRPHGIGQVKDVSAIDQEEGEVPGEDVHGTEVKPSPESKEEHAHTEHRPHDQTGEAEVVGHQERQETDKVRHLVEDR